jgi:hypothetical protein
MRHFSRKPAEVDALTAGGRHGAIGDDGAGIAVLYEIIDQHFDANTRGVSHCRSGKKTAALVKVCNP